jgi:hypothetical protein
MVWRARAGSRMPSRGHATRRTFLTPAVAALLAAAAAMVVFSATCTVMAYM